MLRQRPQQSEDGQAHFAYYDAEHLLSFVWDGKAEVVEVCEGGYGEPVVDFVDLKIRYPDFFATEKGTDDHKLSPITMLRMFEYMCQRYIERRYGVKP